MHQSLPCQGCSQVLQQPPELHAGQLHPAFTPRTESRSEVCIRACLVKAAADSCSSRLSCTLACKLVCCCLHAQVQ